MNRYPIRVMFEGRETVITFLGKDYAEALENAREFEKRNQVEA